MMDTDSIVSEFYNRQSVKKADSTAERYRKDVRNWIEWLENPGQKSYDPDTNREEKKFWEATVGDVKKHLRQLISNGNYAAGTIENREASLSVFYQEVEEIAENNDVPSTTNPIEDLDLSDWQVLKNGTKKQQELKQEVQYLQPGEIDDLANNVPNPKLRNELIIRLLYHTGLRRKEFTEIRLQDIDTNERKINIRSDKTHKNREVYYNSPLDALINRWLNVERKALSTADSEYLFPTPRSERISPNTVTEMVKQAADNAGLQAHVHTDASGNSRVKVTAHVLRHSFAVESIKNGMDTRRLQMLMGHSNIDTTEEYLKFAKGDLKDAVRKFGPGSG